MDYLSCLSCYPIKKQVSAYASSPSPSQSLDLSCQSLCPGLPFFETNGYFVTMVFVLTIGWVSFKGEWKGSLTEQNIQSFKNL